MAAVDPEGGQQYWVDGLPWGSFNVPANDVGTVKFWVDGLPAQGQFPAGGGGGIADAAGSAQGAGLLVGAAESTADAVFSIAGSALITGEGDSTGGSDAVFTVSGVGAANFVGSATADAVFTVAGQAIADFVGDATASAVFTAAGAGALSGVGVASTERDAEFSISGGGSVVFIGASNAESTFLISGSAILTGTGAFTGTPPVDIPEITAIAGGIGGGSFENPSDILADLARLNRKKKPRKPKIFVIKLGRWPSEPEKQDESELSIFEPGELALFSAEAQDSDEPIADEDEEALVLALGLVA